MGQKTEYQQDGSIIPRKLQFQHHISQNSNLNFFLISRNGKGDPQIYVKFQGTLKSQENLEDEQLKLEHCKSMVIKAVCPWDMDRGFN